MEKHWSVLPQDTEAVSRLSLLTGLPPILATVLLHRGIEDAEAAESFLHPKLADLNDPGTLPDIDKAAERVRQAALANQKVIIYGDYDVDGVTGAALLVQFLKLLNMDVGYYVPHRIREGYGLNSEAIQRFTSQDVQLLITVDCGINAVDQVEKAREAGIDVIITDHHEPGQQIPAAHAVIDPKLPHSQYPFRHLSGAGVAFKLAWAIAQKLSPGERVKPEFREFLMDALGLAALGTIADVVPLLGENRIIAKCGLQALRVSPNPGVLALIESAGLANRPLESFHVSFRLAPRLNAAGRMAEASMCVELLTTDSTETAREIAEKLDTKNKQRQEIQQEVLTSVRSKLQSEIDLDNDLVVVLADEMWHAGVLGIVASKVVDDFYRPTVLVSLDEGIGKGSGRSIPQFNLFDALGECGGPLISFGGHSQAAGIKIKYEDIKAFRGALNTYAAERLDSENLVCTLDIDAEVKLEDLTLDLAHTMNHLAPYGEGNREPIFCARNVRLAGQPRLVGKMHNHLTFFVNQNGTSLRTIAFGMGDKYDLVNDNDYCDLAFKIKLNRHNNRESVELEIADIKARG